VADLASLVKKGSPAAWPHELTIVTDPRDPLCDVERLELPVTDERIINFAVRGQIQPIVVRLRDDKLVIVAGRQRWKRATVINHLAGVHIYKGPIKAVHEAIARLKDTDVEKRIVEKCPKGVKLKITVHRGSEAEAAHASLSENEQRDEDPMIAKIQRAQRLSRNGFTDEDLADDFGVGVPTVRRWLARDLDKPQAPKKKRGKATRPGLQRLKKLVAAEHFGGLPDETQRVLRWVAGEIDDDALLKGWPAMARVLGATTKERTAA
jgi:hypothetical protein